MDGNENLLLNDYAVTRDDFFVVFLGHFVDDGVHPENEFGCNSVLFFM